MKIQDYKDGEIHKVGDFYYFVQGVKYSKDYDSIADLVKGENGEQNNRNKPKTNRKTNRKATKRIKKTIKTA